MARNTNIKLRRSATAGAIPTTSNLDLGELALNTYDGKLYAKTTEGSASEVVQVGSATDSYHKIRKSQTLTFTVTVASKTADHVHYNSGSSSAYFIDGLQSPHLHLVPGNTYRFDQSDSSNSGHPLLFYYEADKTTAYTGGASGVTTNGTPGSSGAYTQIVVADETPFVLHYQCSAHGYMGNRVDFGTRNLTGFDTDNLTEGSSNLYFTNARVEAYLDANGTTFPDNVKAQFGAGNDLQIFHDGTTSNIKDAGTGILQLTTNGAAVQIYDSANTTAMARFNTGGQINLNYAGELRFATIGNGVRLHAAGGNFNTTASQTVGIAAQIKNPSQTSNNNGDYKGAIGFTTGNTNNVRSAIAAKQTHTSANRQGLAFLVHPDTTVGTLNEALVLNHDSSATFGGNVSFGDNVKALFGTGSDLNIYHDGTDSRIQDTGTGNLLIDGQDRVNIRRTDNGNTMGSFIAGGAVELYYNAGKKFETTDVGIDVTGEVKGDSLDIDGAGDISGNLVIGGNVGAATMSTTGDTDFGGRGDFAKDLRIRGDGSNADAGVVRFHTNSNSQLFIDPANDGNNLFIFNTNGNLTVPGDLTVNGTTTTLNTATLDVEDKNITLNKGSGDTSGSANGAGITIQDAVNASTDATILWDASDDEFDFSHAITAPGATIASLTYPSSDGSSGQALVTDGSGNLSFSSISAGGNAFGTIAVSGQSNVAADSNSDTLTLVAGSNITLTTDASADSVTIAAAGGSTITVQEEGSSLSTAATTLNFVGSGVTASGSGATKTITVSGGEITVQDEGSALSTAAQTLNFVGAGVTATGSGATKTVTIPGGGGEVFKTIAVSGQSDVVADSATDTLTLAAGTGMTITTSAGTDTITFASSGGSQSGILTQFLFAPSSSTTTFTGSDANSNTLSYTVGAIDVFLNGVKLRPTTDFTATTGSSVVLVNAAGSGDILQINAYTQVLGFGDSNLSELTGDGSTTAFTIAANPNHENNTQVYIDGVYQEKGTYSVSGTTLTFATAPANGTSIEVVIGSRNVTVDDVDGLTVNGDTTITGKITVGDSHLIGDDSTDNLVLNSSSGENIVLASSGNVFLNTGASSLTSQGTTRMLVNSAGKVGIGTSSPDALLRIDQDANELALKVTGGGSGVNIAEFTRDVGATASVNINASSGEPQIAFVDANTFAIGVNSTFFEIADNTHIGTNSRLVIDNTGKIGIGTTTPGVSLDVGSLTDAIRVPNGTTAQRPTAALGQLRYNTTTSQFEGYAAGAWGAIGGGGDAFGTIAVSGQSNVVADQENDTLTLVGAGGITITTTAGTDTVTLTGQTSVNPFTTDLFTTSNASTTAFTLSVTPPSEDNLIVFLEGAYQNKNSYSLSGTTLTLDSAPASGAEVVVHIIQNGVVGAGHTVDEFTGDGSDTTFTLSVAPMNENNTFVYLDGVYQEKSVYSVSGTTLTFATAPVNGHSIEVVTPQVAQVNQPATDSINAIGMFDDTTMMGSTVTSTTMTTTSATTIATHAAATYRTVKYLVQLTQGTDYHSTEINLIHDGTTVYITEYGTLFDNAALGTFNATISSGNILLQLTPGSNSSLTARVVSTAIPV